MHFLQSEPSGRLIITREVVERLGLGLTKAQCAVASAMFFSKPVVSSEAALIVSQIPIVKKSRSVHSIMTAPPGIRMRKVLRNNKLTNAPVDLYTARPEHLEDMAMKP